MKPAAKNLLEKFFGGFQPRILPGEQCLHKRRSRLDPPHLRAGDAGWYCLWGCCFPVQNKPTGFIPIEDEGRMYVTFEMPGRQPPRPAMGVAERNCRPDKIPAHKVKWSAPWLV